MLGCIMELAPSDAGQGLPLLPTVDDRVGNHLEWRVKKLIALYLKVSPHQEDGAFSGEHRGKIPY